MKSPNYTLEEDNILKDNYGKMLITEMIKKFNLNRTTSSIRARANVLKLESKLDHSPEQIEKMRIEKTKKINPIIFKMSRDLAYIIGVLNGDGYIYRYIVGLAVTDEDFAIYFKKIIERWSGLKANFYTELNDNYNNGVLYRVGLGSIIIKNFFYNYCLSKNPKSVININRDLIEKEHKIEFIAGFFDSEGHIMKSRDRKHEIKYYRLAFSNQKIELLNLIKQFLSDMGFDSKIILSNPTKMSEIRGRKFLSKDRYTLYLNISNSKEFSKFLKTTIKRKAVFDNYRE
jgi:hypothetical protein